MLGVARPDGGTVRLLGREAEQAKADIGVVLEDCFFYEGLHPRDVGQCSAVCIPLGTGRCLSRTSTNSAWQIKSIRHCPGACG